MTIDVDPVLAHVGPFALSWYGVFVALGIVAGVWLALREAERRGLDGGRLEPVVWAVLIGGLVGARALHVVDRWDLYAAEPIRILAVWSGGLAILGAVLGGTLAGGLAARRVGLPIAAVSDAAAPGAILGQAIGRVGCLFTGDALGRPTDGFGVTYLNPAAMAPRLGVAYEPVFLYELAYDVVVFGVVWLARPRLRGAGRLFALYLLLYSAGKFGLSFLRTEAVWIAGLQQAQLLALAAVALALVWSISPRRGPHAAPRALSRS